MVNLILASYNDLIINVCDLLIIAIANENIQIIKTLIERQEREVNYNWSDIIIHHASIQSSLDIFDLIVSLKWQPFIDSNGNVKKEIEQINNFFLNTDENGEIPLHWAVIKGDNKIIKRLVDLMLKSGLCVDYRNKVINFNIEWYNSISSGLFKTR